tara:strand:+ start:1514 stop:1798 length:285 start_codon:yes stop_codon:yes gene_type:complete
MANKEIIRKQQAQQQSDSFESMVDMVNHPPHYTHSTRECIDIIEDVTGEQFEGYLVGVIQKYIFRYKHKNKPLEDLKKASWYLDLLIKKYENVL